MAQVWEWKAEGHTQKLVLLALADNANDRGECFPSLSFIAEKCDLSRMTAIRQIDRLIVLGVVVAIKSQGRSNRYRITVPDQSQGVTALPRQETTPNQSQPVTTNQSQRVTSHRELPVTACDPHQSQPVHKLVTLCDPNHQEPSIEPSVLTPMPPEGGARPRFQKPSLEAVEQYATEQGIPGQGQPFMDFYDSNGWKVGRNPMKDWRASVRNWKRTHENRNTRNGSAAHKPNPRNFGIAPNPTGNADIAAKVARMQQPGYRPGD